MTQGIYKFPQEQAIFNAVNDRLPPCDIEAEEAILGGILLDPQAIYRVKERLKPEHFYISAHKDIYQACLRLCKKDRTPDLLSVTSWLKDHDILTRIGGQNKLATVVGRTVSAVNIDALASLIIEKAVRRDLIRIANEINQLGYETELDLTHIFSMVAKKTQSIIEMPVAATKDEHEQWLHDKLLDELTTIYTTCAQPSLRLVKLKKLADEHSLSMSFLEQLYMKSLVAQCTKLLTYEDLKELAGSTVREWLMNGLVPKNTTILLAADGGIGKTKFAYAIAKNMIQGDKFGKFVTTGEKRKILYYQGDESPGDMMQALETLGYSEDDIGKCVRIRFGWSAENMPVLIQDLKEFQPDFVVIDSLTTANRFSIYQESQSEYARPILEMTGLAIQYKTTFLIIHHTNKEGGIRGATAIRNAVSEVWTLTKDNSQTATPYDRLLTIDKSRSRSSAKKYRLMFSPEDLSFTFLGEESDILIAAEQSAKDALLEFFLANRNIRFTSKELAHRVGYSDGHTRNCLSGMAADGLISADRRPGQATKYYLAWENGDDHPDDHPSKQLETLAVKEAEANFESGIIEDAITHDHPTITPDDHPINPVTASDTAKGDRLSTEKTLSEKVEPEKNNLHFSRSADHLRPEPSPDNNPGGDRGGDRQVIATTDDHPTPTQTEPQKPAKLASNPIQVEPGKIYWCDSLNTKVKVRKIVKSQAEVFNPQSREYVNVSTAELSETAETHVTPPPPQFRVGQSVFVIDGQHKGEKLLISSIEEDGRIWLRTGRKGSPPLANNGKPYKPSQLMAT
jgi:replicative DNA helicase